MQLLVKREIKSQNSTIGQFFINGEFFSYCLEPIDRNLTSDMTLAQIQKVKIQNKTAVPTGIYTVGKYFSGRWQKDVPLIENVTGYGYVEIHPGNYPKDTDACLLLGSAYTTDMVENSDATVAKFYTLFFAALAKDENITITYE